MKIRQYRNIIAAITIGALIIFFIVFYFPSMLGKYLVYEDEFDYCEYAFVLSGQAYDRGNEVASLYTQGKIDKIICTGANQAPDIKALGLEYLESHLTRLQILQMVSDTGQVSILAKGTSTIEEARAILSFCLEKEIDECVIISSLFHTRRVKNVFKKDFAQVGIKVYIHGAPSSTYNEDKWWQSEYGLIALNNEYIKLLYYWVKY